MGGHDYTTVFCRECAELLHTESLFCSPQCFDTNFQIHRDSVHTTSKELGEGELEYLSEDKSKYRAKRVQDHYVALEDAFKGYREKTGVHVL